MTVGNAAKSYHDSDRVKYNFESLRRSLALNPDGPSISELYRTFNHPVYLRRALAKAKKRPTLKYGQLLFMADSSAPFKPPPSKRVPKKLKAEPVVKVQKKQRICRELQQLQQGQARLPYVRELQMQLEAGVMVEMWDHEIKTFRVGMVQKSDCLDEHSEPCLCCISSAASIADYSKPLGLQERGGGFIYKDFVDLSLVTPTPFPSTDVLVHVNDKGAVHRRYVDDR